MPINGNVLTPYHIVQVQGSPPAKSLIQQGAGFSSVSATSVVINLGLSPFTTGNTLILAIALQASTAVSSVNATGVSWAYLNAATTSYDMEIWVGTVGPGAGSTVTVNFAGAATSNFVLAEFNNSSTNDGVGIFSVPTLTSNPTTPSYSTSAPNEMVWTFLYEDNTVNQTAGPAGYTVLNPAAGNGVSILSAYLPTAPQGPQSATWNFAASHTFRSYIVGFM